MPDVKRAAAVSEPVAPHVDRDVPLRRLSGRLEGRVPDWLTAAGAREIAFWWLGSRVLVFACAFIAQLAGWPQSNPTFSSRPFPLVMWDSQWYRIVAQRGYLLLPGHLQSDPAFFPLFPILERWGHEVGIWYTTAGLVLANGALLVGLLALYALSRELLPETDARRAAVYAAIFPVGYVFSMAYPEAIVLAASALAGLFAL